MNKLKQNAFWAICGALGAVLVVIFVLVVLPLWSERDGKQRMVINYKRDLNGLVPRVPTEEDNRQWIQRKKDYTEGYKQIVKLYRERDTDLEVWLPQLGVVGAGQTPRPDQFVSPYQDAAKELETGLKDAGVGVGMVEPPKDVDDQPKYHFGFNWEKLADVDWTKVIDPKMQQDVIRTVQKRFWIAKHVANSCVEGEKPVGLVKRVLDVRFFKLLHDDMSNFRPPDTQQGQTRAPEYLSAWVKQTGGAMRFIEYDLPDQLGQTISFGVAVECSFEKVPKFIQNLLNPSQQPRIIVNVVAMRLFAASQNPNEVSETIPYRLDQPGGVPDVHKLRLEKEKGVKPVNATLWLTCQVIDFEPDKVPGFAK